MAATTGEPGVWWGWGRGWSRVVGVGVVVGRLRLPRSLGDVSGWGATGALP